ncbi:uncharacterized protein METZ01_LOCUS133240 [marine metagenome]|uniref:Uncharacterized protein n=1 Tax=marine metagenome TaxID=408172 RepID=A0A381YTM2_9ZZZZ
MEGAYNLELELPWSLSCAGKTNVKPVADR